MLVEIDMVPYGVWRRGLEWLQGSRGGGGHHGGEVTGTAAVAQSFFHNTEVTDQY